MQHFDLSLDEQNILYVFSQNCAKSLGSVNGRV